MWTGATQGESPRFDASTAPAYDEPLEESSDEDVEASSHVAHVAHGHEVVDAQAPKQKLCAHCHLLWLACLECVNLICVTLLPVMSPCRLLRVVCGLCLVA